MLEFYGGANDFNVGNRVGCLALLHLSFRENYLSSFCGQYDQYLYFIDYLDFSFNSNLKR